MKTEILLKQSKDGWFILFENLGLALHLRDGIDWQEGMDIKKEIEESIQGIYVHRK
ncbi:MAG: hypothetical protein MI740_10620 [Halanaerobiales bacterium]|nr:hypothetical protein [Halanaerobiales bacterium]